MPLIKNARFVTDNWLRVGGEMPIPADGDVIVDLDRLDDDQAALQARNGRLGVALPNDHDPATLRAWLTKLELIVLDFPAFTDGRAYSQARQLRTDLKFTGELRATGQVFADQAAFMRRCGIDAFEVRANQTIELWQRALGAMSLTYQRGYRSEGLAPRDDYETTL